nr:MAG TPA: hypothetical protein [Caudoviricetes sp.]
MWKAKNKPKKDYLPIDIKPKMVYNKDSQGASNLTN